MFDFNIHRVALLTLEVNSCILLFRVSMSIAQSSASRTEKCPAQFVAKNLAQARFLAL